MKLGTLFGAGSEQSTSDESLSAETAVGLDELPPQPSLTTSTETVSTTTQPTFKASAKRTTTKKPAGNVDLAALMKQHGIFRKDGILYFPCTASEEGRRAVIEAIKSGK